VHGTRVAWSLLRSSPLARLVDRVLIWTDRMVGEDSLLAPAVTRFAAPMYHPVGTARMGPASDELSVVDQYCRVRLVDGLRVADASVMPAIPSAPTNLACVMLAERVAAWMA
jgi:choline dehydrogenase